MRILRNGFIIIFMAMLILPLVFVDLSSDRVSVKENRKLANHPSISDIKNHPKKFVRDFDAWFKDSTGFREQFLALYNVVGKNKYLRGIRYTNGQYVYLVGEKGHHYFADVNGYLIPKFQGEQFLTDEQLSGMAGKLEEIKTYLDKKGIPFVVMICTNKESIYPEFYPKSIKHGPEPVQLDVITNYLQEHTSVDVFSIKQALLAEKNNYLMYPVSSGDLAHYTEIGAFFTYRELMKHINSYFPEITPYDVNDIEISYDEKNTVYPIVVSLKQEIAYKKLNPSFFDDVHVVKFTWENRAYENINPNLPVILFLCDSYANENLIGKYFAQHFGKAIFIHYINIEHFEEFVDKYKPDIVVFETAERVISDFANVVIGIPKLP